MVAPDDTAAAGHRRAERAQPESPSAGAGAMSSPRVAPTVDAVAGAPPPPQGALAGATAAGREEPPCLRDHLLPMLNLPPDLPAHFIGEKVMRWCDVSACHQRLLFPHGDGSSVLRHLLDVLTREPSDRIIVAGEGKRKRKRMETMEALLLAQCGGLPVKLVNHRAGGAVESRLLRLRLANATVIRGRGYLDFVKRCGFKEHDVVEIWAFRGTSTTSESDSSLHVMIAKKDEQTLCSHCSLPMCSHS